MFRDQPFLAGRPGLHVQVEHGEEERQEGWEDGRFGRDGERVEGYEESEGLLGQVREGRGVWAEGGEDEREGLQEEAEEVGC